MITTTLTRHLAELGKLSFTNDELESITHEMNDIVNLMDKVKEFDENENTYTLNSVSYQNLREDKICTSYETDKILSNSKATSHNCFTVPKVI